MTLFILEGLKPPFWVQKIQEELDKMWKKLYNGEVRFFIQRLFFGSSHDRIKVRNYQTVLFFAAPWCALVLIDLELQGNDGLIHSNSDSVWTSVGNVNWCMDGQYPAVKVWNKLGFVHNTSSPDTDLEYIGKRVENDKNIMFEAWLSFF